jgi:hypothetical protein
VATVALKVIWLAPLPGLAKFQRVINSPWASAPKLSAKTLKNNKTFFFMVKIFNIRAKLKNWQDTQQQIL